MFDFDDARFLRSRKLTFDPDPFFDHLREHRVLTRREVTEVIELPARRSVDLGG